MQDAFYDLGGPPRAVPLSVKLRLLFGGALNQTGWLLAGFTMIFFWAFVLNADISSWYYFSGKLKTVTGKSLGTQKTGASSGGSKHTKGTPIYENHYSYTDKMGKQRKGVSYATGRKIPAGKSVQLEIRSPHV